jgi:hypothetical protein
MWLDVLIVAGAIALAVLATVATAVSLLAWKGRGRPPKGKPGPKGRGRKKEGNQ